MMLRGYDHALFYHFCFASQYMAICLYTAIRVHNALWLYVAMLVYMDDLPFPWYVVIQWSAMNVCVHVKHFWDRCCNALTNYALHLNLYHSSCDEVGHQFGAWNLSPRLCISEGERDSRFPSARGSEFRRTEQRACVSSCPHGSSLYEAEPVRRRCRTFAVATFSNDAAVTSCGWTARNRSVSQVSRSNCANFKPRFDLTLTYFQLRPSLFSFPRSHIRIHAARSRLDPPVHHGECAAISLQDIRTYKFEGLTRPQSLQPLSVFQWGWLRGVMLLRKPCRSEAIVCLRREV